MKYKCEMSDKEYINWITTFPIYQWLKFCKMHSRSDWVYSELSNTKEELRLSYE